MCQAGENSCLQPRRGASSSLTRAGAPFPSGGAWAAAPRARKRPSTRTLPDQTADHRCGRRIPDPSLPFRTSERLSAPEVEPKRLIGHGEVQGDVSPGLAIHHESQADPARKSHGVEEVLPLVEEPQVADG